MVKNTYFFRTDIYFTKYCLAVEIGEKGHTNRDLIFENERQKALEKKTVHLKITEIVNLSELILVEKNLM